MKKLQKITATAYFLSGAGMFILWCITAAMGDRSISWIDEYAYKLSTSYKGIFFICALVALNLTTAILLLKRKLRVVCLLCASILLIWIPIGTILGIATWIILTRKEEVAALTAQWKTLIKYAQQKNRGDRK